MVVLHRIFGQAGGKSIWNVDSWTTPSCCCHISEPKIPSRAFRSSIGMAWTYISSLENRRKLIRCLQQCDTRATLDCVDTKLGSLLGRLSIISCMTSVGTCGWGRRACVLNMGLSLRKGYGKGCGWNLKTKQHGANQQQSDWWKITDIWDPHRSLNVYVISEHMYPLFCKSKFTNGCV